MSIVVECPHCESRYNLQPDMLGQTMRCPNPDCRETFVVREAGAATPPAEAPAPVAAAEEEFVVPVVEGEPAAAPAPEPAPPLLARAVRRPAEEPVQAEVIDAQPAAPRLATPVRARPPADGPAEYVWSDVAGEPAPDEPRGPAAGDDGHEEEDDEPLRRRRRRKEIPIGILFGLVAVIVFIGIGIAVRLFLHEQNREQFLAQEANEAFKNGNYVKAVENYDVLLRDFPSSQDREKYEFFHSLATLHNYVGSVTFRENPGEGVARYREFLSKYGDEPIAQPDETGFGHDVFEGGRKIADGMIDYSQDKLKKFRADRNNKLDELAAAEQVTAEGLKLLPTVEKYRIKDIEPLTKQKQTFDDLTGQYARERNRLEVLRPWRKLADDPTDLKIAEFVRTLAQHQLSDDREATQIVEESKLNMRRLIRVVTDVRPPVPTPADAAPRLLFVAPPAGEKPNQVNPPPPDVLPETFFAVARGELYALDADTGALLWAAPVGRGRGCEDVPVRLALGEGGTELAIVPSDLGGKPGLTARVVRTGEPYWHQPLEAPAAGRPVLVGKRVYVPLLDEAGTVVEIEGGTGNRLAHIPFRQRLGAGIVRQAGTGLLYVLGEGRRVFLLDVERLDADGNRLPMACLQVLFTGHDDQALRSPPVLSGPAGPAPAPRFLILPQAKGTDATAVKAFAVPPVSTPKDGIPPEVTPAAAGAADLPGHVWFPPAADGERVAVVTDSGVFALFGTNQPGNQDPGLFPVPVAPLANDPKKPVPGQVVYAEEGDFWVLSRGNLQRLRLGLTPAGGLQVAPAGLPRPTGRPLHRGQANTRRDTVLAVVEKEESNAVWGVAFDPTDGRIRWQRKLGVVPPAAPVPVDGGALLVDEDGGVYVLPPEAAGVADVGTKPIAPGWVGAPPTLAAAGLPKVAADAKGGVWVLVPEQGKQLRVRRYASGKFEPEKVVALPDRFAGDPVPVGGAVAVPLADGFVYRFEPGAGKLTQGPQWRGEGVAADADCFLSPAGGDEFVGSDGGRRVVRWRWPTAAGADWKLSGGPWEARAKVAFPPAVLALGATARRLLIADEAGNVWGFDADKADESPAARWRAAADGPIPAGRPTNGFAVLAVDGRPRVVYGVERRHVVCLDPLAEAPAWVVPAKPGQDEILGWSAAGDRVVVTELGGRVTVLAGKDGAALGTAKPSLAELFPQTVAVAFGPEKVLMPLWDGSAVFMDRAAR